MVHGLELISFLFCVDETFHGANSELRELPAVELSTLPLILKVLMFVDFRLSCFLNYVGSLLLRIHSCVSRNIKYWCIRMCFIAKIVFFVFSTKYSRAMLVYM